MTCAKRQIECKIYCRTGYVYTGRNDCDSPQEICPRLPGEDYTKCTAICGQTGHAEIVAINEAKMAGADITGATVLLSGAYKMCTECARALRDEGVSKIIIKVQA